MILILVLVNSYADTVTLTKFSFIAIVIFAAGTQFEVLSL